jgi:hypothetical protein
VTAKERAEKLCRAHGIRSHTIGEDRAHFLAPPEKTRLLVEQAILAAESEAYERAAQVVDRAMTREGRVIGCVVLEPIAAEIRKLGETVIRAPG